MIPRLMDVETEFEEVCSLVNSAYEVYHGDEGTAYKKRERYPNPSRDDKRLMLGLRETWVVLQDGRIVGCIRYMLL